MAVVLGQGAAGAGSSQSTGTSTSSTGVLPQLQQNYQDLLGKNVANYGAVQDAYAGTKTDLQNNLQSIYPQYGAIQSQVENTLGLGGALGGSNWGVAGPAKTAIDQAAAKTQGNTDAQLINSGLAGTSLRGNLANQNTLYQNQATAGLGAQLAQTAAGYQASLGLAGLGAQMQGAGMQSQLGQSYFGDLSHYQFANTAGNLTGQTSQSNQTGSSTAAPGQAGSNYAPGVGGSSGVPGTGGNPSGVPFTGASGLSALNGPGGGGASGAGQGGSGSVSPFGQNASLGGQFFGSGLAPYQAGGGSAGIASGIGSIGAGLGGLGGIAGGLGGIAAGLGAFQGSGALGDTTQQDTAFMYGTDPSQLPTDSPYYQPSPQDLQSWDQGVNAGGDTGAEFYPLALGLTMSGVDAGGGTGGADFSGGDYAGSSYGGSYGGYGYV